MSGPWTVAAQAAEPMHTVPVALDWACGPGASDRLDAASAAAYRAVSSADTASARAWVAAIDTCMSGPPRHHFSCPPDSARMCSWRSLLATVALVFERMNALDVLARTSVHVEPATGEATHALNAELSEATILCSYPQLADGPSPFTRIRSYLSSVFDVTGALAAEPAMRPLIAEHLDALRACARRLGKSPSF